MGGFARVHRVLKRPKNLESRLFFEFKWGYFFYVHREDELGLWHDKRLFRSWQRVRHLVEETDMQVRGCAESRLQTERRRAHTHTPTHRVIRCHRPGGRRHLRKSRVFRPRRQYALGRPPPPSAHKH